MLSSQIVLWWLGVNILGVQQHRSLHVQQQLVCQKVWLFLVVLHFVVFECRVAQATNLNFGILTWNIEVTHFKTRETLDVGMMFMFLIDDCGDYILIWPVDHNFVRSIVLD